MSFHVYILKCADGSYYTGHTDDIEGRLSAHMLGLYENSYTVSRMPVEVLWSADFPTRAEALGYEQRIKGWSRAEKEALIAGDVDRLRLLSKPKAAKAVHPGAAEGCPAPVRPEPVEGRTASGQRSHALRDARVQAWLRETMGLQEYRRVVRESNDVIVISKFEHGFSQELFATVDRLPELFDDDIVGAEYSRLVEAHRSGGESPGRTAVWREAGEAVLNRLCAGRGIDDHRRMFIVPGIESVQAVLDSILWTAPTIDQDYSPNAGEVEAYAEFEAGLLARERDEALTGRDIFTRYYGELDGRRVENYCPGAPFARRLLAQAWRICTRRPGASA